MKIYLDVSCLSRPFDDQSQARIQLEASAVTRILERTEVGPWMQISSEMATIEIDAITDPDRRSRVRMLLPDSGNIHKLESSTLTRGLHLEALGFMPADALHVAAAEEISADVFLSCDDRLCRLAKRHRAKLKVRVANPLDWLKEMGDAADS